MGQIIFIVGFMLIAYIGVFIFYRRQKKQSDKFLSENGIEKAEEIKADLLENQFALLKKQMQGAPIDAFTQCAYIATAGDKVKSAAATTAKTVAWAAVGVKAKYRESDNSSYLVLSGNDLHYIFFEEGEAKDHIILDESRLSNARLAEITSNEKVMRMSSISGRKPTKINMNINGSDVAILYYAEVNKPPEGTVSIGKDMMVTMSKMKLMGQQFKAKFGEKYPHLVTKDRK